MSENLSKSQETPAALDWAALLARWMDFARAAVALPSDAQGDRWRASISPIITLQAVTLALGEVPTLPRDEQAVAIDRATLLIERETEALAKVWEGDLPSEVGLLLRDAAEALAVTQSGENNIDG